MRTCDICGTPGHKAAMCPLKNLQHQKDPYGMRLRPRPQPVSDPAVRAADENTVFLIPPKRLV